MSEAPRDEHDQSKKKTTGVIVSILLTIVALVIIAGVVYLVIQKYGKAEGGGETAEEGAGEGAGEAEGGKLKASSESKADLKERKEKVTFSLTEPPTKITSDLSFSGLKGEKMRKSDLKEMNEGKASFLMNMGNNIQ